MIYKLKFLPAAKKEWDKLAEPLKKQIKTSLLKGWGIPICHQLS